MSTKVLTTVLMSTDSNIGIVYAMKQGSSSLNTIMDNHPETFEVIEQNILNTDFTFIIPLRSPYEKWVSGNLQELGTLELNSKLHEQIDDYQVRFAMLEKRDERHQKWLISDEERECETFVAEGLGE